MIEINNLTYHYSGSKKLVFDDFNLSLEHNKIYGLLGKNGMGKSTLLYLLCGLLRPTKGSITFRDIPTMRRKPEILSEMFIVPEEFYLPSVNLDTYVKLNKVFYPRFSDEILYECLSEFELPHAFALNKLSMGQRKKVYMSFALATNTQILLMDEPTNGLDIPAKSQFRKVVSKYMTDERVLIISTHQVHDIETLLDHILILSDRKMLLNASVEDICRQYIFEYRTASDRSSDVVYSEPALQGNAVMAHRRNRAETQLNLELLFSAVTKGLVK